MVQPEALAILSRQISFHKRLAEDDIRPSIEAVQLLHGGATVICSLHARGIR